jgi:6-phosphofructokinase 1
VDRREAFEVGSFAVEELAQNASGKMVSIRRESGQPYRVTYQLVPLEKVVAGSHPFPTHYIHPQGNLILPAFKQYLGPLIGDPLPELLRFPVRS